MASLGRIPRSGNWKHSSAADSLDDPLYHSPLSQPIPIPIPGPIPWQLNPEAVVIEVVHLEERGCKRDQIIFSMQSGAYSCKVVTVTQSGAQFCIGLASDVGLWV